MIVSKLGTCESSSIKDFVAIVYFSLIKFAISVFSNIINRLMMFEKTDIANFIKEKYTMATKSLIDDDSQVPNLETITDA